MLETEIKLEIKDQKRLDSLLRNLFDKTNPVTFFEEDVLYDFRNMRLFRKGSMFRLRVSTEVKMGKERREFCKDEEPVYRMTWKGPSDESSGFKEREEVEFTVNDFNLAIRMIESFGLEPFFLYQKYRTVYNLDTIKLTVDETPMGVFLEIEGDREKVHETALKLGFDEKDFITKDYYTLWQEYRRMHNIRQVDMRFAPSKTGRKK